MSPKSSNFFTTDRGRRTSGKGRFEPSEPLHMTTRRAAAGNPHADGMLSGGSSVDDEDDYYDNSQDSTQHQRPTTSQSLGSKTSAKEGRTSLDGSSKVDMLSKSRPSSDKKHDRSKLNPISPVAQQPSPTRKRKRSTPTPQETPNGSQGDFTPPVNEPLYRDPRDEVELVPFEDLSDRETEGTASSDDEPYTGGYLGVTQSTEITPAITPAGSEAVSPISEDSNTGLVFPAKTVDVVMTEAAHSLDVDEQEDVDDVGDVAGADEIDDLEDVEDGDDVGRLDIDGKPRRRLAGRRRADHPDPIIEAALRRQLQLKSAYRNIARALKPVLAEIALKTTEELEANAHLHEEAVEYQGTEESDGIQKMLDDMLARRKAQLDAQLKWNQVQLERTFEGEQAVRRAMCELKIGDNHQLQLDRLDHDLLTIARQAQLDNDNDGYETEDESGDVIPRPIQTGFGFKRTVPLGSEYHSRSLPVLEMDRATSDLQSRVEMHEMIRQWQQGEHQAADKPGFTVMDNAPRLAANARREAVLNTKILADAAAETERVSNIPVIPNEEAIGLQVLADLSARPPGRKEVDIPTKRPKEPFGPPLPMQMAPPPPLPLRAPIEFESSPVEPSPRSNMFQPRSNLPVTMPPSRPEVLKEPSRRDMELLSQTADLTRPSLARPLTTSAPIASRHLRQESLPSQRSKPDPFSQSPARFERPQSSHETPKSRDDPLRERFSRQLTIDRSPRLVSHPERNEHAFSRGGPLSIERVAPAEHDEARREPRAALEREQPKPPNRTVEDQSPSDLALQKRPPPAKEVVQGPGASEVDPVDERPPTQPNLSGESENSNRKARSRASSIISLSTTNEASPDDASPGDSAQRGQKQKGVKSSHALKASKTDRQGLSRKMWKAQKDSRRNNHINSRNGPSYYRFRLNSTDTTPAQTAPPFQHPPVPHPAPPHEYYPGQYGYGAPYGPPPPFQPPSNYPYPYTPEYGAPYPQRHSMSRASGSNGPWPSQPPSPLFALPQGSQPPGGPSTAEQWPNYGPPPPSRQGQQTPQSQPPGPYNQRYGGQAIAPATPEARYMQAAGANHPPAFAQQQRQQESNPRRRAQSDVQQGTKFIPWGQRKNQPKESQNQQS